MHFLVEIFYVLIIISLKFIPKGSIDNKPALVQLIALHVMCTKPLSESVMAYFFAYMYASLSFDELTVMFGVMIACGGGN